MAADPLNEREHDQRQSQKYTKEPDGALLKPRTSSAFDHIQQLVGDHIKNDPDDNEIKCFHVVMYSIFTSDVA